ncbi:MAG: hypothetical protein GXY06_07635 [Clostridiaceae bacterium]|nr:hypothetical protein [Clostridiaceae bacterium]
MRQANNKVRMPAYMRATNVESQFDSNLSVGDVLRKANKRLIIRQIVWIVIYLLLVGALTYGVLTGKFENAVDYIVDSFLK